MINVDKEVRKALKDATGLEVYPDKFVNSDTEIPCISYSEYDNSSLVEGDKIGYSTVIYHIKIWTNDLSEADKIASIVDSTMRINGFIRNNKSDLWYNDVLQRALKYTAKGLENFVEVN